MQPRDVPSVTRDLLLVAAIFVDVTWVALCV